ncbi:UNVERIFIED_CONTAM: hypothetical protein HDU68_011958 [Siphonaria sp. JEL0065]|nr:hypothetical protein HDU68_011958 [Siphonaria sp. JEL0065]
MSKTPRKTHSKPRVYKKTPLFERISNAPFEFWLFLNEWFQLCEWEEWLEKGSNTIGIAFNVVYLLVKTYDGDVFTDDEFIEYSALKSKTATVASVADYSWFHTLARFVEFIVILASIFNTIHLFTRTHSFTLFQHPTEADENRPYDESWNLSAKTRSANLVELDIAATDSTLIESDSDDDIPAFRHTPTPLKRKGGHTESAANTPLKNLRDAMTNWTPWSSAKKGLQRLKKNLGPKASKVEKHWVLGVWNPPKWSMTLFCWLSPPAVFTLYVMNHNNWNYLLPIALLTHGMIHGVMNVFVQKLVDQDILNNQLQKEYNRFVYSLPPFRQSRTVGVQTTTTR